jgi:hypothetical protein
MVFPLSIVTRQAQRVPGTPTGILDPDFESVATFPQHARRNVERYRRREGKVGRIRVVEANPFGKRLVENLPVDRHSHQRSDLTGLVGRVNPQPRRPPRWALPARNANRATLPPSSR